MAKLPTITTITSANNNVTVLNNNFDALKNAFTEFVSRDGETPNTMTADLDLNSQDLLNVKALYSDILYVGGALVNSVGNLNNWAGEWTTSTTYSAYDTVYHRTNNTMYRCLQSHTSGTFATDLGNGVWEVYIGANAGLVNQANVAITGGTISGITGITAETENADTPTLATGVTPTFSLAAPSTIGSLTTGTTVGFRLPESNTAGATLNVDTTGDVPLRYYRSDGVLTAVGNGDIQAHVPCQAIYDGTYWVVTKGLSLSSPSVPGLLKIVTTMDPNSPSTAWPPVSSAIFDMINSRSWQDVSGSRSVGTNYQNTTGLPLTLAVRVTGGADQTILISTDNFSADSNEIGRIHAGTDEWQHIEIPDQLYYKVSGGTVNNWWELRV